MASQIHRNIILSYANRVSALIGVLVLVPLCTRFLGPRLYGEWIVITSIVTYLALAGLGIDQTLTNRIAEARTANRQREVSILISTAFFAYIAIAILLVMGMAAFSGRIARALISRGSVESSGALCIIAVMYIVALPGNAFIAALRGFERVDSEQNIGVWTTWFRNFGVAGAVVSGLKLMSLAVVYGSAIVSRNVATYCCTVRKCREVRPSIRMFSFRTLRNLIVPSLAFFVLQISGMIGFGVDNLVIGYSLGPEDVTRYAVPFSVMITAASLFGTASTAVNPTLTSSYVGSKTEFPRRALIAMLRIALFYATAGFLVFWIAGVQLLHFWAGPDAYPGAVTYRTQLALFAIQVLIEPAWLILVATTRHYGAAGMHTLESVLNLVLSLWWVRHWGLAGVVAGTVVARMLTSGWYIPMAAMWTLDIRLHDFNGTVARGAAVAAVAIFCTVGTSRFYDGAPLSTALFITTGVVTLFAGAFAAVSLTQRERQAVVSHFLRSVTA